MQSTNDPYSVIAPRFEEIFPTPLESVDYLLQAAPPLETGSPRFLDLGCATGELARMLADRGAIVVGVDNSPQMIALARERATGQQLQFEPLDLLHVGRHYGPASFACVSCLGNTLPHLESREQIDAFFEMSHALLSPRGALVLQLMDYAGIEEGSVWSMPTLDLGEFSFSRHNRMVGGVVEFTIEVGRRDGNAPAVATQRLLALSRAEVVAGAEAAGFLMRESRRGFTDSSLPGEGGSYLIRFERAE